MKSTKELKRAAFAALAVAYETPEYKAIDISYTRMMADYNCDVTFNPAAYDQVYSVKKLKENIYQSTPEYKAARAAYDAWQASINLS